jgi:hypothetical protein
VPSFEPVSTTTISSTAARTESRQAGSASTSSRTIMHRLMRIPPHAGALDEAAQARA